MPIEFPPSLTSLGGRWFSGVILTTSKTKEAEGTKAKRDALFSDEERTLWGDFPIGEKR